MFPDNDNPFPRDHFMPKLSPWRWVWLALAFSIPVALGILALLGLLALISSPADAGWEAAMRDRLYADIAREVPVETRRSCGRAAKEPTLQYSRWIA